MNTITPLRVAIHKVSSANKARNQYEKLCALWQRSDKKHVLVEPDDKPDLIFMTDISGPGWFSELRNNRLANANPNKCFAVSDTDFPMPLLHGIYTSAHTGLAFASRYRSGSYNLYPDDQKNEFVENCTTCVADYKKRHLYSFQGRDSSNVRKQLFAQPPQTGALIENTTSIYSGFGGQLPNHRENQLRYFEVMRESNFVLCPRGVGAGSIRLFEAMSLGVAPVILSDRWILPEGPDWVSCAIRLKESEISNIYHILTSVEHLSLEMGRRSQAEYQKYFSDDSYFNFLVDSALSIQNRQKIPEQIFWRLRNHIVNSWKLSQQLKSHC